VNRYAILGDEPLLVEANAKTGAWDLCAPDGTPVGTVDLGVGDVEPATWQGWIENFAAMPAMLAALSATRSAESHEAKCEACMAGLDCPTWQVLNLRAFRKREAALGVLAFMPGVAFWNDVADGTPETEDAVLAWVRYEGEYGKPSEWPNLAHCREDGTWVVRNVDPEPGLTVTHWREIPEPRPTGRNAGQGVDDEC